MRPGGKSITRLTVPVVERTGGVGVIYVAGAIFVAAVGFIAREYGEVEKITSRCRELKIGCHFHPDPFVRYAIFGSIAMVQVGLLFLVDLLIEERRREQNNYAPSWRR